MTIPHNGNLSNGRMFSVLTNDGNPLTREIAELRARMEPLIEVTPIKGDGEAHPFLSPNDEFADYETWDRANLDGTELGGRQAENWPFTAIRLDNGHTVVSLTHGNKVVELDVRGEIVWKVTNDDVQGLLKDPCGAQRLANGNTVIGSHGANQGISMVEVTREKKIVWTSDHPLAAGVHHFQILTTNGKPEPGIPLK